MDAPKHPPERRRRPVGRDPELLDAVAADRADALEQIRAFHAADEGYQALRREQKARREGLLTEGSTLRSASARAMARRQVTLDAIRTWRADAAVQLPGAYPPLLRAAQTAAAFETLVELLTPVRGDCRCEDTQTLSVVDGVVTAEQFDEPQGQSFTTFDSAPTPNDMEHGLQLTFDTDAAQYTLAGESQVAFRFSFTPRESARYCVEPIAFVGLRSICISNAPAIGQSWFRVEVGLRVSQDQGGSPETVAEAQLELLEGECVVRHDDMHEDLQESDAQGLFVIASLAAGVPATIEVGFRLEAEMRVTQPDAPFPWSNAELALTGPLNGSYAPMYSVPEVHVSRRVCDAVPLDGNAIRYWLERVLHQPDPFPDPFPPPRFSLTFPLSA